MDAMHPYASKVCKANTTEITRSKSDATNLLFGCCRCCFLLFDVLLAALTGIHLSGMVIYLGEHLAHKGVVFLPSDPNFSYSYISQIAAGITGPEPQNKRSRYQ